MTPCHAVPAREFLLFDTFGFAIARDEEDLAFGWQDLHPTTSSLSASFKPFTPAATVHRAYFLP